MSILWFLVAVLLLIIVWTAFKGLLVVSGVGLLVIVALLLMVGSSSRL